MCPETVFSPALGDFLTSINRAPTIEEAWGHNVAFMSDLGARHVNVTLNADEEDPTLFSTMPCSLKELFLEEVRSDRDPTIAHFRDSSAPCFAGFEFEQDSADLCQFRRNLIEEAFSCGIRSALVFPVSDGANGTLGKFGFNTDLSDRDLTQFHAESGISVHLAAVAVTERIAKLHKSSKTSVVNLTSRERECLLWLARGFRNCRIAERLGVSGVTVEFHLSNACRKLKARTRGQALVRAIQLGLLAL